MFVCVVLTITWTSVVSGRDKPLPEPIDLCWDNYDCPLDQYCSTPLGQCEGPGECVDRLGDLIQCFDVWIPVCGCDGQTYSNGCYAAKAAVSIDYEGECVQECFDNGDCPADQYCSTPLGQCEGPGECIDRLSDLIQCLDIWLPVCGCDGQTYSNGCYAAKAAVSIDYEGECIEECFDNDDCPADQYCSTPLGQCEGPGECVDRLGDEIQCFDVWIPVCGCDGQTYSNGCYAAKAAVSIDYEGECGPGIEDPIREIE
jgi:hypothetical protein